MKLKVKVMFLLGSLLIAPPIFVFSFKPIGNERADNISMYNAQRYGQRHKAHLHINKGQKRSAQSCYGYIENNTLYLYFSSPLENVSLDITNADTGTLVFSGKFTGTSLAIPLECDGNEFIIDIN